MALRVFQSSMTFMLLFILITITPSAYAASGQTYTVGTSNLLIRNAPSSNGEVIGHLNKGDQVVVFKESHGWAQTYYRGQEAWVALHYLYIDHSSSKKVPIVADEVPQKITIAENSVRLRSGPGTAYEMVASTGYNATFQLLATENNWHKVSLNNGDTGWVASWLTNDSANATASPNPNLNQQQPVTDSVDQSLGGYQIVLDPGHGGHDPGSIALDGSYEKDLILSTAHVVAERLRAAGATVRMTRTDDNFISLEERVSMSNRYNTDAFISLHYDAYPISSINGFSTHFYTSFGSDRLLAQSIQSALAQHVNLHNRGIMNNNYYILRENKNLAVLVELGFMTNPYDLSTIQTKAHQNNVAEGIANGLINYFR